MLISWLNFDIRKLRSLDARLGLGQVARIVDLFGTGKVFQFCGPCCERHQAADASGAVLKSWLEGGASRALCAARRCPKAHGLANSVCAAHFLCFDMRFEDPKTLACKLFELIGHGVEFGQRCGSPNAPREPVIGRLKSIPIAGDALLFSRGDHFLDVAPTKADPFTSNIVGPPLGSRHPGQALELGGARDKRGQIEPKGPFDDTPCPLRA